MSTVAVDGIWNLFHYQEGEKNILHPDDLAASGLVCIPANQNWQIGQIRTYASDQRLYLIEYEVNGQPFGNQYLAGLPPFSLENYRSWLEQIAVLPGGFDAGETGE